MLCYDLWICGYDKIMFVMEKYIQRWTMLHQRCSSSDSNFFLTYCALSRFRLPCDFQTRGLRLLLCGEWISKLTIHALFLTHTSYSCTSSVTTTATCCHQWPLGGVKLPLIHFSKRLTSVAVKTSPDISLLTVNGHTGRKKATSFSEVLCDVKM